MTSPTPDPARDADRAAPTGPAPTRDVSSGPASDRAARTDRPTRPARTGRVAAAWRLPRVRAATAVVLVAVLAGAATLLAIGQIAPTVLPLTADPAGGADPVDPALADAAAAALAATDRARLVAIGALVVTVAVALVSIAWVARRHVRHARGLEARMAEADARGQDGLAMARRAVIDGLVKLAGSRDPDTGAHLGRVQLYVRILGEDLVGRHPEVDAELVEIMVETAPLHDIGKVGVPDEILLKPGPLTDAQRIEMQKHVLFGLDTLIEVKRRYGDDRTLRTACEIAFAHHERFDGSGYPFGLAGETIPIAARIVALADVYDALCNERVYKVAYTHEEARAIIVEHAGTHFDPAVVEAFLRHESVFELIAGFDDASSKEDVIAAARAASSARGDLEADRSQPLVEVMRSAAASAPAATNTPSPTQP